jgi:hypothetical protein
MDRLAEVLLTLSKLPIDYLLFNTIVVRVVIRRFKEIVKAILLAPFSLI